MQTVIRIIALFWFSMHLLTITGSAQTLPSGPQVLTFHSDVDDSDQPYAIYLPNHFDESREYPLVISLHGAGSNHRLNLQRVFGKSNEPGETDVEASVSFPELKVVDYIVVSPYARGTMGYQSVAEKDVLDVLADVKRRFRIDEDRVYLTGLSMGGGGALWIGLSRPDVWAAIAAVCPAPPSRTELLAVNALNVPMHFFHGDADPVVPVEVSRQWVERLQELGTHVDYEEYQGVGHGSWVPAYADGHIFDWFDRFERDRHPNRVRFTSDQYETDRAYWVRLDRITPGTHARIDAHFVAPDSIEVSTSELDGFTVTLAGHPQISDASSIAFTIDGDPFNVEGQTVSFQRIDGSWHHGLYPIENGLRKTKGREGPLNRAVAGRHVVVYGTQAADSPDAVALRRDQAVKAGTWSDYRGSFLNRVMVFPRIIPDSEVRSSDFEHGNLVLLGTRETNAVINELAESLPMHLEGDPQRYGLTYIYPSEDHYVLVSSGVPWWEFAAEDDEGGLKFGGDLPPFLLSDDHDFILYDKYEDRVIVQGRFDNRWQLPAEAIDLMGGIVEARIRER